MGSVNVNSNQNTTAQQSQNTQFGAQQSSVNEYVSGNGGSNAYETRRTSVPLGTRRAPSHTRSTVQTNPPGTQGANPGEAKHGTAGMPVASGERVVQNAGHVDQSGSAVNQQRSPGMAPAGNRSAVGNGPRFAQRETGNARHTNRAEHGTAGTVQSSEQNNVAVGAARVNSSLNAVTQNPTQQGPGNTRMPGQSPTIRAQSSGSSTEPRASARPEARQGRNAPSSGQAAGQARRGIDVSPPSMADTTRPAQSFTAQQKDHPPRQQNPTLHHGTAGITPPTAISPDKQENRPARASSRDEGIGVIPMTPEDILDLKGGGDDGRAEE